MTEVKTDRELIELAAKAAGLKVNDKAQAARDSVIGTEEASLWIQDGSTAWNPLRNNGDALWLAVKLRLSIVHEEECVGGERTLTVEVIGEKREDESRHCEMHSLGSDPMATVRRTIVRAVAEIQRAKEAA